MKFKKFIEDFFLIDDATTSALVPFKFRPVQEKYYSMLADTYDEKTNFNGAREIILKARKEGFTSLLLAIFCADIIKNTNPVRYLEISYKDDATKQHFRRAKNFILSFFERNPQKWTAALERRVFRSVNEGCEFVLRHNGASFYVGTASARTGERGGTTQGVIFCASGDTKIIRWDSSIVKLCDLKPGEYIIDGEGKKAQVKDVLKRELKDDEEFYEIQTYGDNERLKLTGDHKVLCRGSKAEGFKPCWKRVKDLTVKDYIGFPTREFRIAKNNYAGWQRWRRGRDYYWQRIISIKKADREKYVYDIVLSDEPHSYLTVNGVIHNSEASHYPDTGIMNAMEIIEATRNMVAVGNGMIFIETTANGNNFFRRLWLQAKAGEVDYKPRFFSWRDFYTQEEFEAIKLGFSDKKLIPQEYPENDIECFLLSGDAYFDTGALKLYLEESANFKQLKDANVIQAIS